VSTRSYDFLSPNFWSPDSYSLFYVEVFVCFFLCCRHMKNVSVDLNDVHYAFGEDGTLKDTEIVIMNRHENQWKEVCNYSTWCMIKTLTISINLTCA